MKKNIKLGEKELHFEANLGTTMLYQMLTGENMFSQLTKYKGAAPEKSIEVIDIYLRMAYVMNVQAESPDIKTMKSKMNDDSFLEWRFSFEMNDLTPAFIQEISTLWASTQKTTAQAKNS